jgi:molecular chaperone DnaJ
LARKLHPDVTGDDPRSTERFKEITEAYEVLCDAKRRRSYDMFGDRGGAQASPEPPFQNVTEIFEQLFQKRRKPNGPEPGVDVERPIVVSFAEAIRGVEKQVDLELLRACSDCHGNGYPPKQPPEVCPDCQGSGERPTSVFPLPRACGRCEGTGKVRRHSCRACAGEGQREVKERLKVTVPAGVDHGTKLRIKGRGAAGKAGGRSGDLYMVVELVPDARFERDGADLATEVKIGLRQALVGGSCDVPLPDGYARMTIPMGTQGGQLFRLKGKGFPRMGGGPPGDLFVTVQLRVPTHLDAESRALVDALAAKVPDL